MDDWPSKGGEKLKLSTLSGYIFETLRQIDSSLKKMKYNVTHYKHPVELPMKVGFTTLTIYLSSSLMFLQILSAKSSWPDHPSSCKNSQIRNLKCTDFRLKLVVWLSFEILDFSSPTRRFKLSHTISNHFSLFVMLQVANWRHKWAVPSE